MDKQIQDLQGVARTLIVPLQARAMEARRKDAIVRDENAQEILDRLGIEFDGKFNRLWFMHLAIVIRTKLLDDACKTFLQEHPAGVVINLGCGLDSRFGRVDNGRVRFYELDQPEVIELRRRLFKASDRDRLIAKSVLDFSWTNDVPAGEPTLLIAEGLLYYLAEEENRRLLDQLAQSFPGAQMLIDMFPPIAVGGSAGAHPSLRQSRSHPRFKWGLKDSRELETWNPAIRFVEEWLTMDFHPRRWKWMRFLNLIPALKRLMSSRIVKLRFALNSVNKSK